MHMYLPSKYASKMWLWLPIFIPGVETNDFVPTRN